MKLIVFVSQAVVHSVAGGIFFTKFGSHVK